MKVLVIEDDQGLAENLKVKLNQARLVVDLAEDAEEGWYQLSEFEYDCLVLDVNLPDGSGFDLCRKLRESGKEVPVLMMTARDGIDDRIKGLELGADDYVLKPVDSGELIARIRALIRRAGKKSLPKLKVADLELVPGTQRVRVADKLVELSAKEFGVLEFLMYHSDEVVTRSMLMEHVWGSDFETFSNVIEVYIKNLRKKIDTKGRRKLLHTIRGSGYSVSDKR